MNINLQNIEILFPRVQGYLPQEYQTIMQSSYNLFQKAVRETQENEQEKEAKEYFVSLFIAKLNEVLASVDYSSIPQETKSAIKSEVQSLIDKLRSFQFEAVQVAGSYSLNGIPQTKVIGKYSLNGLSGIKEKHTIEDLKKVFPDVKKNEKGFYIPLTTLSNDHIEKRFFDAGIDVEVFQYVRQKPDGGFFRSNDELYDVYFNIISKNRNSKIEDLIKKLQSFKF